MYFFFSEEHQGTGQALVFWEVVFHLHIVVLRRVLADTASASPDCSCWHKHLTGRVMNKTGKLI